MPPYKKQHYLPAAYLKYFSTDQTNCTRDASVWRLDRHALRQVPIVSQCSSDYFYSKTKPADTEAMFQQIETALCNCVDKIKLGRILTGREYGQLLLAIFDLHLRNATHKNMTGKEGIDAYNLRSRIFMSKILLGKKNIDATKRDITTHVGHYWGVEIVSTPPGHEFVTSDHPSVWITLRKPFAQTKPSLHMATLPLTPTHTAVAYDRRVLDVIANTATDDDDQTLNGGQIQNAEKCIYTSTCMAENQLETVKYQLTNKTDLACEVYDTGWQLALQHLPADHYFSFIRLKPPLF